MKSTKLLIGLALALLIAGTFATPTASAELKTQSLEPGDAQTLGYEVNSRTEISIEVSVTSGGHIDIFLLDESNYERFSDGQSFDTIEAGTFLDIASVDARVTLDPGNYYFIIDNSAYGEAYTGDPVTYGYEITGGLNWTNIFIIAVVVAAVVAVAVYLLLRGRKRKKLAAQQAAQMNEPPAGIQ